MAAQDEQHRLTDGVSASAIRAFLEGLKRECPDSYTDMTTEDACQQLVVPRTKQPNCAYADLLRRDSPQEVGKATVFVSHAWRYKIADVLGALLEFAEEQQGPEKEEEQEDDKGGNQTFFWFDLFMNNQNANVTANLPQDWWSTTFKESIASIGRVLLVLMPWHDPVPLTRAWCLWEVFCGISNEGTEISIRLPQREEKALQEAIRDKYEAVTSMLVRVDAQRAEARSENDKAMIFEAIETWAGGFGAVNQVIKGQLREWCLGKAIAAVETMKVQGEGESDALPGLCHQVGNVLKDFGETDNAIAYWEAALTLCLKPERQRDKNVAALYNNLGTAYKSKGNYDKAIAYYEKARELKAQWLGEKHPSTATTYHNLGEAYRSKGEYDRAKEQFQKAREIKLETLGEKHPSTASTDNNLGLVHAGKGEYDTAIAFYEKAREVTVEALGETHPSTANIYSNLGIAYNDKGEYDRALAFHEKAGEIKVEVLGEKHPSTADTYDSLGEAYHSKGECDRAIIYYEKAREIRAEALGQKHPNTAATYTNLGNAYRSKGEVDKAFDCYEKDLVITRETQGEKHPSTAMSLGNMGVLHEDCGDTQQAIAYIQRAADVFEEALGSEHPHTLKAKSKLQALHQTTAACEERAKAGPEVNQAHSTATNNEARPELPMGWLQKRKRNGRTFLPRWFSLTADGELVYSKTEGGQIRRRIPLSTVQSVELSQDTAELHVTTRDRTFVLRVDGRCKATLKDWCAALSSRVSSTAE